jgi:purple acid phosphatase-like protein
MPEVQTTTPTRDEIIRAIPEGTRYLRVIEILSIFWTGATNTKHYSNQRWVEDFPALSTDFGFTEIEARFQRQDWFVEMPRTTEISDDVVKLTMWDGDGNMISDFIDSGEGTKCRVTQYFPDFNFAIEIWWGFLKVPKETEGLWFNIEAASGLRSPNLSIPRRAIYPGCQAIFGGLINPQTGNPWFDTQAKIDENECPYNRHIGGSKGNLDPATSQPYTTCPRAQPSDCDARLGDHVHYLGFDVVIETYRDFNRWDTSHANDNVLRKPIRVVYGERWVRDLSLLAFVSDNTSGGNAFLKTLWIVCEGPIKGTPISEATATDPESPGPDMSPGANPSVQNYDSGFIVNGSVIQVQHTDFSGIWGVAVQPHLVNFTPTALNYKHTSIVQLNYGRANFQGFTADQLECRGKIIGNKKIRMWSDPSTELTPAYTNNRAWCLLNLYTNKRYGLGVDISRFELQDWITLAAYGDASVTSIDETGTAVSIPRSTFNAEITEGKWSDHLNDICLAGYFTLPYYHQGKIRIDPIEPYPDLPTMISGAPVFSDQDDSTSSGMTRNIIFENNRSTLRYSWDSDSKLPNQIKLNFDDASFENQSRPLLLKDDDQQLKAGFAAGDETQRPVEKEYNAVGVDTLSGAYRLARRILDLGPFEQGGLRNNFKITFRTWSLLTDALGLHPYSIIQVVSDTVNRFQEGDGSPYEYFRIQKLTRQKNLQMAVEAQLFPRGYISDTLNAQPAPGVVNDSGSNFAAPESVDFGGVSATAGKVNFTLNIAGAPPSGPIISGVTATSITATSATITWTTDIASDSQVQYGTTTSYGSMSALNSTLVTSHSVNLTGLTAATTYHYRVISN